MDDATVLTPASSVHPGSSTPCASLLWWSSLYLKNWRRREIALPSLSFTKSGADENMSRTWLISDASKWEVLIKFSFLNWSWGMGFRIDIDSLKRQSTTSIISAKICDNSVSPDGIGGKS